MSISHERRKQPDLVRRRLLDRAGELAVEGGLAAVTVQAVAAAAGVTKGGLFHHFANKQALVEAVFGDLLDQLDGEIDAFIAGDREPAGRFTRAYVETVFVDRPAGSSNLWAPLSISMIGDAGMRRLWNQWLAGRLERHRATDGDAALELVRLAADGVWLAELMGTDLQMPRGALRKYLIALTKTRTLP